jgi:hypothetical protein
MKVKTTQNPTIAQGFSFFQCADKLWDPINFRHKESGFEADRVPPSSARPSYIFTPSYFFTSLARIAGSNPARDMDVSLL